jgi:UDP-N-acetylmuramoyl-tripeptide--D-alanyl-D-alanine ligase
MIASVLAQAYGVAHRLATPGNLNNDIGVPISLLRLRAEHRAAVLELGMNRVGEIAWLTAIVRPTVALVNNAQREHQAFLDGTEATARENGRCLVGLAADGVAIYPGDDPHTPIWRGLAGTRRTIAFGQNAADCAVWAAGDAHPADFMMHLPEGDVRVALAIDGRHNVRNALAAAACCSAIGLTPEIIAAGLAAFRPVAGRLVRTHLPGGATLIDDSYNANPDSVRAAIDVLATMAGLRVLVLGDMGEVGDQGPSFHREIGAYARQRGIDRLLALGEAMREAVAAFIEVPAATGRAAVAEHFMQIEPLTARVRELADRQTIVLVKGSRFMKMERVLAGLADDAVPRDAH